MNYYEEIRIHALKAITEAKLMASVARNAEDSFAYKQYIERAMEAEDIAEYARQKKLAKANVD